MRVAGSMLSAGPVLVSRFFNLMTGRAGLLRIVLKRCASNLDRSLLILEGLLCFMTTQGSCWAGEGQRTDDPGC